ncbi:hypothetical protein SMU74_09640 [Streptococcus mutans M2A]|nr:hypothetical protein SMU74_09640 [Streptococcus mutans M2A]
MNTQAFEQFNVMVMKHFQLLKVGAADGIVQQVLL